MIDLENMTVLIVDDMEGARKSIRAMLMVLKYGGKAFFAENGLEALKILNKEDIDLAIVDWNMPVMNGSELLSRIRENRALRYMPVIMVTAEANREIVAEAAESDIDAYILKPLSVKSLGGKISSVVEKANNPPPMFYHLRRAREFEEKGDIDQAVVEARLAMKADPNSSRPVHELGYYCYKKKHFNEAKRWFLMAVDMNKLDVFAFHYLGNIYLQRDNINKAAEYFDKAMKINPRHVSRGIHFGKVLVQKGMLKKAQSVFDKAIDLSDDPLTLQEEIVELCLQNEMYAYSIKLMKFIIQQVPTRYDLALKIGLAYENLGERKKALAYLIEAGNKDQKNIDIMIHIAKNFLALKQPIKAEQVIKSILEIDPENSEAGQLFRQCL